MGIVAEPVIGGGASKFSDSFIISSEITKYFLVTLEAGSILISLHSVMSYVRLSVSF